MVLMTDVLGRPAGSPARAHTVKAQTLPHTLTLTLTLTQVRFLPVVLGLPRSLPYLPV